MKIYFCENLSKPIFLIIFFISLISLDSNFLKAEYLVEELLIDSSTKTENDNSVLPTNPFEIVEKLRRYNSLNNATNPSDALDDAIESFTLEENKEN